MLRILLAFLLGASCFGQTIIHLTGPAGYDAGGSSVSRVAGSDTDENGGSVATHTITVPASAETMLWCVSGFDTGTTTKIADGTYTLDPGGDDIVLTAAIVTTGTNRQGGLFIVDVTAYAGGNVDIGISYATTGSWSGDCWHVAVFYDGVNMTSLPGSAYTAIAEDSRDADGTELTTGSIATASDGMAAAFYGWFQNDGAGGFTGGVTEFLDTTISGGSQTTIVGDAATTGANVTITGDGASITYHSLLAVTLKP